MYVVVTIHSKGALDRASFFSGVPTNGTLDEAISRTRFNATPEIRSDAVHWDANAVGATIIFGDGSNGLQIHVENHLDRSAISQLKRRAEDVLQMVRNVAQQADVKLDGLRIDLYAEDNLIQEGLPSGLWKFLQARFFGKLLSPFIVAIIGAIAAGATSGNSGSGFVTFIVVIVGLFLRVLLEGLAYKGKVE